METQKHVRAFRRLTRRSLCDDRIALPLHDGHTEVVLEYRGESIATSFHLFIVLTLFSASTSNLNAARCPLPASCRRRTEILASAEFNGPASLRGPLSSARVL
jgi:hypothetical protein